MTMVLAPHAVNRHLIPAGRVDDDKLESVDEKIRSHIKGQVLPEPMSYVSGTLVQPNLIPGRRMTEMFLALVKERIKLIRQTQTQTDQRTAKIIAIVPTYETESGIGETIDSLLKQTRPIDLIVICVNGPGDSDVAYRTALPYASYFRNVIIDRPNSLAGKVNTLNWMYRKYIQTGGFDFVLGIDADIEADPDMVFHLDTDLIRRKRAAGVMARYSFRVPEEMKGKSRSLVYGQRHEFAMTGIKHQLKKDTSEILGGQATLFRADALISAAEITDGDLPGPWDARSKVEDAELTRTFQSLGYETATSRSARAWTGLMYTASTWQKQRRKWQDGHLEDMMRDFHPWLDRRRWFEQFAMGWNLSIRVMFAALLATSISLDRFVFLPLWLIPMGLAIVQSLLVALKIPNRRLGEVVRSLFFIPGEIYYVRTLSVWLDSVIVALLNVKRDGWKNQAAAEESKKKSAVSVWMIILVAVLAPTTLFVFASKVLPGQVEDVLLLGLWTLLSAMTIGSIIVMTYTILRIVRNFRNLAP